MGIIIKQSIKGSIWSYLGVVIGFITTSYLFPNYLTTDTVGLLGLLMAWSVLFAQFSALGFHSVTSRLFPYFRNPDNGHNGFLFINFLVMSLGILLFIIFYYLIKDWLQENNAEKSTLFSEYMYLIIPMTFFTLLFTFLDLYNKVLYDAVLGTFLQEFVQRVLIIFITILYAIDFISVSQFIIAYVFSVSFKGLIILVYLIKKKEINLKPRISFLDKKLKKEIINISAYGILSGLGINIVFYIDKIIINQFLGLGATGVYTIAFFFGTLVVIPSRPLLRITSTLIADAWKQDDLDYIKVIYKKSCLNQFIIASIIFGGIWVNIDNILIILGPDYSSGKWVIFFIAMGYLIDMATGANGVIISYSKYYRVDLLFLSLLVIVVITSMYFFIPLWGITGAAISITLSFFINNLMRFVFLYKKYKMQPFGFNYILVIVAVFTGYVAGITVPRMELIWDIFFRSIIILVVFWSLVLMFKISNDINNIFNKFVVKIKTKYVH